MDNLPIGKSINEDVLLVTLQSVKQLFDRIRKSADKAAVSELAQLLLSNFSTEQIMSLIFSELTKPGENAHRITEALFLVSAQDDTSNNKKSDNTDGNTGCTTDSSSFSSWMIMTLDNFSQLLQINPKQTFWTLMCLFLIGCSHPLRNIFLKEVLYGGIPEEVLNEVFIFSGIEFFRTQLLDKISRKKFIDTLKQMGEFPYTHLSQVCTNFCT